MLDPYRDEEQIEIPQPENQSDSIEPDMQNIFGQNPSKESLGFNIDERYPPNFLQDTEPHTKS